MREGRGKRGEGRGDGRGGRGLCEGGKRREGRGEKREKREERREKREEREERDAFIDFNLIASTIGPFIVSNQFVLKLIILHSLCAWEGLEGDG